MAENTYWHKQGGEPLYPDMLWSRPETKGRAGKLLIIGGQADNLAAPAQAFAAAQKAGAGHVRVLLPKATEKVVGKLFPEAEFAPSNKSGSFSNSALDSWLELGNWADGVLLAGDLGKNSETAVVLGKFTKHYNGLLAVTGDSLDYFIESDSDLVKRAQTASVINYSQLQKLSTIDVESHLILNRLTLLEAVEVLHEWTGRDPGIIITQHQGQVIVAVGGQVSTTPAATEPNWPELAAYISVWWLQNPEKPLEAISTAAFSYLDWKSKV